MRCGVVLVQSHAQCLTFEPKCLNQFAQNHSEITGDGLKVNVKRFKKIHTNMWTNSR